jgi:DNA replication protein DnaC
VSAKPPSTERLTTHLEYLKLAFMGEHFEPLTTEAASGHWTHVDYLAGLAEGEALLRQQRSIQRRIRLARFPVIKTLEQFQWSWPKKINRAQVENLFRLQFIEAKANVIVLGGVGLGKTHLLYRGLRRNPHPLSSRVIAHRIGWDIGRLRYIPRRIPASRWR